MTPIPIRQLAEEFPDLADKHAAPYLLNMDENQDGLLEKAELQNPEGQLRCDWRVQGMGEASWKKLESLLEGRSWISESPFVCKTGYSKKSPARQPTASAGLFRGESFDWIFQLGKGVDKTVLLDLFHQASLSPQIQKTKIEVSLPSGRILRAEMSGAGHLQKIHYLDAQNKPSLLCRMEFWEILRAAGRFESFFAANPYVEQEREVWQRYYSPVYTFGKTPTLSLAEVRKKKWKGLLLFPDIHGEWKRYLALDKTLREEKIDWLAMEMLPQNLQSELDDFLTAASSSSKWSEAKRKLQNYLQPFWAKYYKMMKDPEGNPYYRLLLLCRQRKIKVIALDAPITYTLAADTRMSPLNIGTRNRLWAEKIPDQGRGIVYGGEFHFTGYAKVRVQDFLWERDAKREIQLVKFSSKGL